MGKLAKQLISRKLGEGSDEKRIADQIDRISDMTGLDLQGAIHALLDNIKECKTKDLSAKTKAWNHALQIKEKAKELDVLVGQMIPLLTIFRDNNRQ